MTIFGQLVIGPPGSGKSTYCREMRQFLSRNGRKVAIVNLDPANDSLPYAADIDINEYTTADDVMSYLHVGPNCAILHCIEFLERCVQKIAAEIEQKKDCYFLIDCPGQVELYTHHESLNNILACLANAGLRLCCVHLVDSHYCSDAGKFISTLLLSLTAMLHMGLPHLNVLSKIDVLREFENKLSFSLDYYTDVLDLSYLVECLEQDAITSKHKKLNQALASCIEAYGLVHFTPLNVFDSNSLSNVLNMADKANGYIFKSSEERNVFKLLSTVMSSTPSDLRESVDESQQERKLAECTLFNYTADNAD
ncbi:GPN-loop GTPase 2 isoform X2 [Planococcus citri]|uniref:GPN-loop GTPase 2 isoform X2 n=1 Tax=Planococcus citri TaxID=170843 RepID=UPI0031F8ADF4